MKRAALMFHHQQRPEIETVLEPPNMKDFTENEEEQEQPRSWDDIYGDTNIAAYDKVAEFLGLDTETANKVVMLVESAKTEYDTSRDTDGFSASMVWESMQSVRRLAAEVSRLKLRLAIEGLSKRGEGKDIATRGEFVKWYVASGAGHREQAERLYKEFCLDHNKRHKRNPQEQIDVAESGHYKMTRNQMISLKAWLPTQLMVKRDKKHRPPSVPASMKEAKELEEKATRWTTSHSCTRYPIEVTATSALIRGIPAEQFEKGTRKICNFPNSGEIDGNTEASETPKR